MEGLGLVINLACRYCKLPWPGDRSLSIEDLRNRMKPDLPVCIKAPPRDRWLIDSGINGHLFEEVKITGR